MTKPIINSAMKWAKAQGLPDLTGKSEKQIAAANTVRRRWLEYVDAEPRAKELIAIYQFSDEIIEQMQAYMRRQTDAVWWMDSNFACNNPVNFLHYELTFDPRFVFELAFTTLDGLSDNELTSDNS